MDQNALISLLKDSMDMVSSSVPVVVGALVTTLFLRKNTATTEFEKIKAGKFDEVISELLENGKMTYLEYYKYRNFREIAKLADQNIQVRTIDTSNDTETNYNFDWFIKFYEYAGNISNDEMRHLWAAVFAGEITNPGTTSISLMHSLSMMRHEQAMFFCNIARFALTDIKTYEPHLLLFVALNRMAYGRAGITPAGLKELERLGLIECNFSEEYVFMRKKAFIAGNKIITVYGDPNNADKIKAGNVTFTKDGQLLYSIIDDDFKKYRSDILNYTVAKFINRNCRVKINDNLLL